jgi:hypothetical protein
MDLQPLLSLRDFVLQNPTAVVGFLMPFIIEVLNKNISPESNYIYIKPLGRTFILDEDFKKSLAAFVVCLAVAVLFELKALQWGNFGALAISFGIIYAESQAVFKLYFRNSYFRAKLLESLYGNTPETTPTDAIG